MVPEILWSGSAFLIGLTGAIGSGKSSAAAVFAASGAVVLDADRLAKDALLDPGIQSELRVRFAPAFENDILVPARMANLVFEDKTRLKALTDLTYPIIRRKFADAVGSLPDGGILVYDVPLLFEAGLEGDFDLTICISTDPAIRHERLRKRGLSDSDIKRREELQFSSAEKERRADLVISNNETQADLAPKIQSLIEEIRSRRVK
ncbi:MAG: dephospho-CoA kinase [Spirochaetia bacterium]|nr:dephospho-CoA kinase [Spirochaetia bacterium]